jgi:hypothetical protein
MPTSQSPSLKIDVLRTYHGKNGEVNLPQQLPLLLGRRLRERLRRLAMLLIEKLLRTLDGPSIRAIDGLVHCERHDGKLILMRR